MLFGVEPNAPFTMVAVSLLLFGVYLAAAYFPARRAARLDPVTPVRAS